MSRLSPSSALFSSSRIGQDPRRGYVVLHLLPGKVGASQLLCITNELIW